MSQAQLPPAIAGYRVRSDRFDSQGVWYLEYAPNPPTPPPAPAKVPAPEPAPNLTGPHIATAAEFMKT